MKNVNINTKLVIVLIFGLVAGYFFSPYSFIRTHDFHDMHREDQREVFIAHRDHMVGHMIEDKEYKCCLEKPCTYCIEKTPGHGEGATCNCLKDVVEGKHPCGECIGEILEGHGNPLLASYFASAIAEEVGEQHVDTLKAIISEKYQYAYEKQR